MQEIRDVGKPIHILHNMLKRELETANPRTDITGAQGRIIQFLVDHDGEDVFSKDIEREFNMRRATAADYLYLMEKNGMITRMPVNGDRRLKKIELTDKAREVNHAVRRNIRRIEEKLTKNMTRGEINEFLRMTDVMIANLTEE